MRSQIAALSRAFLLSPLVIAIAISAVVLSPLAWKLPIASASPVPVAVVKDQARIVPELTSVIVPHLNDPWVLGVTWITDPIVPTPVKTITIRKGDDAKSKKHKRSSIDDIIKSAPRAALLAHAKAQIGKRGPQLGLPSSLWCMDFVSYVLRKVGLPSTGSRMARSPLTNKNFVRVAKPVPGDIVVIARGRSSVYGHVALYNGSCGKGGIRMLGGNQSGGRVTNQCVYRRNVVGYVRPRAIANDSVQVAATDSVPRVGKVKAKVKAKVRVVKRIKRVVRQAHVEKPYWTREG